jgi:hypothetical protein
MALFVRSMQYLQVVLQAETDLGGLAKSREWLSPNFKKNSKRIDLGEDDVGLLDPCFPPNALAGHKVCWYLAVEMVAKGLRSWMKSRMQKDFEDVEGME